MAANYKYVTDEYANHVIEKVRLVRVDMPSLKTLKKFSAKPMTEDPFHAKLEMSTINPLTGKRKIVTLEKAETLKANTSSLGGLTPNSLAGLDIGVPEHLKGLTVGQLRANVEKYYADVLKKDLGKYSLSCSNCQQMGINTLRASGFEITPEIEAFADQKAGELVPGWARRPLDAFTTSLAWQSNMKDKYFYKKPEALRIHHTSLAAAGHHPRQQYLQSFALPSTVANMALPTQPQME